MMNKISCCIENIYPVKQNMTMAPKIRLSRKFRLCITTESYNTTRESMPSQ